MEKSARHLNILFAIGSLGIGGAERQLSLLAKHLREAGHRIGVFALEARGPLLRDLDRARISVFRGGLGKGDLRRSPWRLFRAQWNLFKTIQFLGPDVLHAFLPLVTFMGALAGRICGVPAVITSRRALARHQERVRILGPLDRLANRLSHRVTVNSRAVLMDTAQRDGLDPGRMVLIYNGVEAPLFPEAFEGREQVRKGLGFGRGEKVVITVANLIPYKGHRVLLQAAREVLERVPKAHFLLVGEDRGIGKDLEARAAGLGIQDHVWFLGPREDLPGLFAASDLSVLPSYEEGFSNVILESMAAGLPVVATQVGGNVEAVVPRETGWLVPPGDPVTLAEKMADLLADPARARRWGRAGRQRVARHFSLHRMVEEHLKLYEDCLLEKHRRARR